MRPCLDYGKVIYDQSFNKSFQELSETIQYNGVLPITDSIRGGSKEKLHQELQSSL